MAAEASSAATDDTEAATRHRLFATVEDFAATEDRPDGISGIIAIDPDRGDWRPVVERKGIRGPRLVLGGRGLAFLDGGRDPKLWVVEPPWGSAPRQVAQLEWHASFAWSAGARRFFVSLGKWGTREAWRIAPDGSDRVRLPIPLAEYECVHDCSPDGEWLLVGNAQIKMIRPDGTDSRELTREGEKCIRPRFSPDGSRIVYASSTHDGESLWITDIAGRERSLILPESPVTIVPRWSPDGSRFALKLCDCVRGDRGWMVVPRELSRMRPRIDVIDADGGNRRPLNLPVGRIILGEWG